MRTKEEIDALEQSVTDLRQALLAARSQVHKMAVALTMEGQTKMAETAANEIEELFAVGGLGRADRFIRIVKAVRRQIGIAACGAHYWND